MRVRYWLVILWLLSLTVPLNAQDSVNLFGRITQAQDSSQSYTLTVAAGDTLTARLTRLSGNLDFFAALQTEGGRIVARPTLNGSDIVDFTHTFEEGGTYALIITRGLEGFTSGDYVLTYTLSGVSSEAIDEMHLPTDITAPYVIINNTTIVRDDINTQDREDRYYVFLRNGQSLDLSLQVINGNLTPMLVVATISEKPVAREAIENANTSVTYQAESIGWYIVIILPADPDASEGNSAYTLDIHRP